MATTERPEDANPIRLLIGRREFLLIGGSLIAAGPLGLPGCGGSGGSNGGGGGSLKAIPTKTAIGKITLPAGMSAAGMKVVGLSIKTQLDSTGKFTYKAGVGAPSMVALQASTGETVFIGMLDDTHTTLDSTSTAKFLLACPLGVGTFVWAYQHAYLQAFDTSSKIPAIAAAITAALQTNGVGWMTKTTSALQSAFLAAMTSFKPAGTVSTLPSNPKPKGIIFSPTDRTSGLELTADGLGGSKFTNYFRRRSYIYAFRVSYKTSASANAVEDFEEIKPYPLKLGAINGMTEGALVALAKLGTGEELYQPIDSPNIPVPLHPDEPSTTLTNYAYIALGLGTQAGDEVTLSEEQLEGLKEVSFESLLYDLVLPVLIFGLIPVKQETIEEVTRTVLTAPAVQDLLRTIMESEELKEIPTLIEEGEVARAALKLLIFIVKSETLLLGLLHYIGGLGASALATALSEEASHTVSEQIAHAMHFVVTVLNVAVQLFDTLMSTSDLVRCKPVSVFKLSATRSTVKLDPPGTIIDWPNTRVVKANVIDATLGNDAVFTYRWTCNSAFGIITDSAGQQTSPTKTDFTSTSDRVTYIPGTLSAHGQGGDSDGVQVEVRLGPNFDKATPIGSATCRLTYRATISPASVDLNLNDKQTFTANVSKSLPAGTQFEWTLNGTSGDPGSIGATKVVKTTKNTIAYTAGKDGGAATLALRVLNSAGGVITTGSASIQVAAALGTLNLIVNMPEFHVNGHYTLHQDATLSPMIRYTGANGDSYVMYSNYKGYPEGVGEGYQHVYIAFGHDFAAMEIPYVDGQSPAVYDLSPPGSPGRFLNGGSIELGYPTGGTGMNVTDISTVNGMTTVVYSFDYVSEKGTMHGDGTFIFKEFLVIPY